MFGSVFIGLILLVLACQDEQAEQRATELVSARCRRQAVKSKTVCQDGVELTMEVCLQQADTGFVNSVAELPGVRSAVLVSYNGEYMS